MNIEKEIVEKGLTAPRITLSDVLNNINSEHYFTAFEGNSGAELERRRKEVNERFYVNPYNTCKEDFVKGHPLQLLTFCVLVLKNGFTVTGESACASPENFDAEIGRKIARENAVNKIWPLMGYELKTQINAG